MSKDEVVELDGQWRDFGEEMSCVFAMCHAKRLLVQGFGCTGILELEWPVSGFG